MEIPRHWRLKAQRYRLEGWVCPTCSQPAFPPHPVCYHCITQPEWIAGGESLVLPAANSLTSIESTIRCQITERITV